MGNQESGLLKIIDLLTRLREFEDNQAYIAFEDAIHSTSNIFYDNNKGKEDGKLHLDDSKAKNLSETLWGPVVDVIATKYLKLSPDQTKLLESITDPAEKKKFLEREVEIQWGLTKQALYDTLNARGTVTRTEFANLIAQLPAQYLSVVRGKITRIEIDDINKASEYNNQFAQLKSKDPQTFRNVGLSKDPTSVDAVINTVGAAAGALPANYKLVLDQYKGKYANAGAYMNKPA